MYVVEFFVRENCCVSKCLFEQIAVSFQMFVWVFWQNAVIIWEVIIYQFGGEDKVVNVGVNVVAVNLYVQWIVVVVEYMYQFNYVFMWYDY